MFVQRADWPRPIRALHFSSSNHASCLQDPVKIQAKKLKLKNSSPAIPNWYLSQLSGSALRGFIGDTLCESAIRDAGVFRHKAVRRTLDEHFARRANYDNQTWVLVTFTVWYKN